MLLIEKQHVVQAVPPAASPASTERGVSLKNWDHVTVIINLDTGTSPTGTTVTLKQGTAVGTQGSGLTGDKALGFSYVYVLADANAGDSYTKTTVTSNTFDTGTTSDKNEVYVIEVDAETLDTDNDFDCFRVDVTGGATSILSATYILSKGRYAVGGTPAVSAIID